MFRKEVKEQIVSVLKRSHLTEHAFQVTFGNSSDKLVHISYVLLDSFYFEASLISKGSYWVNRAPGDQLLTEQVYSVDSIDGIIYQLGQWLQSVETEDGINSEADEEVDKLKEIFFRDLARHIKDENRHFTKEEADDLFARVEKLEQQIEKILTGQKKSATEVQSVKNLFQEAKKDAGKMTKKKWLVVGGGKIFNALLSIAKSKEGRTAIADSVKGLLENKNS
jgi:uncharacterized protein YdcH (DUF465 family)